MRCTDSILGTELKDGLAPAHGGQKQRQGAGPVCNRPAAEPDSLVAELDVTDSARQEEVVLFLNTEMPCHYGTQGVGTTTQISRSSATLVRHWRVPSQPVLPKPSIIGQSCGFEHLDEFASRRWAESEVEV